MASGRLEMSLSLADLDERALKSQLGKVLLLNNEVLWKYSIHLQK